MSATLLNPTNGWAEPDITSEEVIRQLQDQIEEQSKVIRGLEYRTKRPYGMPYNIQPPEVQCNDDTVVMEWLEMQGFEPYISGYRQGLMGELETVDTYMLNKKSSTIVVVRRSAKGSQACLAFQSKNVSLVPRQ